MTASPQESEEVFGSVTDARGYTLPLHEVLAAHDPDALAGYEEMMQAVYLSDRRLDRKTKELVYVGVLVSLGAAEDHISAHMEKAVRDGATPQDVLEVIELTMPAAGVARASVGFDLWRRTFKTRP